MAQMADKVFQSSISAKLPAGLFKLQPPGKLVSWKTESRRTRKAGVVSSTQSDVQTLEFLKTRRGAQNGPSFPRPEHGTPENGPVRLSAQVTITKKRAPPRDEQTVDRMDVVADGLGKTVTLQLVGVDVDPLTGVGIRSKVASIKDWVEKASFVADKVQYTADFEVSKGFGVPGALIITNKHQNEFFLESISVQGRGWTVHFPAYSWVHSEQDNPAPRVFFSNQVYLPSSTPKGLRDLREQDLKVYRGDGKGVRKAWENIYDFDVYNDLCDVDKDPANARPILGGSKKYQYPRRNRTGRPPAKADPSRESRLPGQTFPYVPRDEAFEPIKQESYFSTVIKGLVQQTMPGIIDNLLGSQKEEFDTFDDIDQLYSAGIRIRKRLDTVQNVMNTLRELPMFTMLPDAIQALADAASEQPGDVLRYPIPQLVCTDRFAWIRDDEFGRQTLAGLNPCTIERLKVFPPESALDDVELYGPKKSAIKKSHLEGKLNGLSVEEALEQGKLFILDYHDLFMPYIININAQQGRTGYASRTLFFLTKEGTLSPLVIELCLPSPKLSRQVFVPGKSSTKQWLWKLAKAHVDCNDAGFHQLVSHWLRTHASVEPYVIAANRQLSPMHPIFKLLHPHFRYTLEINAAARQSLICADGVIEKSFLPGKYAMEMSSAFYGAKWRFDQQGLPQELIARGLAVEDQTKTKAGGVKLLIEDYPFANDGLLVWDAIEVWVTDYVKIYYKHSESIQHDEELQKWWEEVRTRGHADKKDEDWWPQLQTRQDLIGILTIMIWVTSGLHAAVNFGQYDYAGYMPNKPTLMRRHIPSPHTPEFNDFLAKPQEFFLRALPSQAQSTVLMAVIESLSTHSPDEEYLGADMYPNWFGCPEVVAAYNRFQEKMVESELEIRRRNGNTELRNRNGAGIVPYNLLVPWSKPGITGQGVPNSISI